MAVIGHIQRWVLALLTEDGAMTEAQIADVGVGDGHARQAVEDAVSALVSRGMIAPIVRQDRPALWAVVDGVDWRVVGLGRVSRALVEHLRAGPVAWPDVIEHARATCEPAMPWASRRRAVCYAADCLVRHGLAVREGDVMRLVEP